MPLNSPYMNRVAHVCGNGDVFVELPVHLRATDFELVDRLSVEPGAYRVFGAETDHSNRSVSGRVDPSRDDRVGPTAAGRSSRPVGSGLVQVQVQVQ